VERPTAGSLCDTKGVLLLTDARWLETVELQLRTTLGELERTSRDQALSLAAISHDVRGALFSIAGLAELLRDQPPADDTARLASQIVLLAQRTSEMMVELIEYARVSQSSADSARTAVSGRALVAECARSAEVQCVQKGLAFHLCLPDEGAVMTDQLQLMRVIQNLLSNAVRYTPNGSVRLSAELTPAALCITVGDTGVGIPGPELDSVFTEFYRTEQAKRMDRLGTGLGLATVKRLCHLLGATLHVDSAPGVGSTFRVIVPRSVSGHEALAPRAA
jgi:signal transduction histidine kinase